MIMQMQLVITYHQLAASQEKCAGSATYREWEKERLRQCTRFVPQTILEQVKQLIGPKVSTRVAGKINKQKDFNARSKKP